MEAALIYKLTKSLRAVQLLLGHAKLGGTVRNLGIEVDDRASSRKRVRKWQRYTKNDQYSDHNPNHSVAVVEYRAAQLGRQLQFAKFLNLGPA